MRCPECHLENERHAKLCERCGTELMRSTPNRTNQVWNTDIDVEQNRKNSRIALVMLGVAVALMIALVALLCAYLPQVMAFSMDGIALPNINISDFVDEVFWEDIEVSKTEPLPEPLAPMGEYDFAFIDTLTAYAIELSCVDDPDMQREIHRMFYPEFEYFLTQEFHRADIMYYSPWLLEHMGILCNSDADTIEYLQAQYDVNAIILSLDESYDFLRAMPDVEAYFVTQQLLAEAAIEVEYSLWNQLEYATPEWSKEYGCQVVYYTNDTPYTIDLNITNDFVTDAECYSSSETYYYNFPDTTLAIPLYDLEKVGDQDHTWTIDWEVVGIYMDLTPIDEYYK